MAVPGMEQVGMAINLLLAVICATMAPAMIVVANNFFIKGLFLATQNDQ